MEANLIGVTGATGQLGRLVVDRLVEADYAKALEGVGLPPPVAAMIAQSSASAASDVLYNDGLTISHLTGRPTTDQSTTIAAALAA